MVRHADFVANRPPVGYFLVAGIEFDPEGTSARVGGLPQIRE